MGGPPRIGVPRWMEQRTWQKAGPWIYKPFRPFGNFHSVNHITPVACQSVFCVREILDTHKSYRRPFNCGSESARSIRFAHIEYDWYPSVPARNSGLFRVRPLSILRFQDWEVSKVVQLFVGKQRFPISFPMHFLFKFHSFLFISYSLLILFIFCPMSFLFIHYSLPIHFLFMFIHTFSFPLTWEIYQHSKKQEYFLLAISYLKTMHFKPQINGERGGTPQAPKKWFLTN